MWGTDLQAEIFPNVGDSVCEELKSLQHSQGSSSSQVQVTAEHCCVLLCPADLCSVFSQTQILSWIPVHFSVFPLSASEHWKTCFPPFL